MRAALRGLYVIAVIVCAIRAQADSAADRLALDAREGRPLVAHLIVALCDNQNQGIVPVPARLGNGQNPRENLYWGARYGIRTYFRKAAGWRDVPHTGARLPLGVLERAVFVREVDGVRLVVVADAWDGSRMREAVAEFLETVAGRNPTKIVAGGEPVSAGGDAHVLAFIGHNGLMDFAAPSFREGNAAPARAAIVLACASRPYFAELLRRARAHPLLLTTGLMAPEAYSLEAALGAWFLSRDARKTREAAADAYHAHQHCGRRAALRLFAGPP